MNTHTIHMKHTIHMNTHPIHMNTHTIHMNTHRYT